MQWWTKHGPENEVRYTEECIKEFRFQNAPATQKVRRRFISSVWLPWGKIRFEKLHINDILSLLTLLSSPFLALSCINLLTQAKHWLSATSNFQANFFRQSTERSDNYLIFEMRWMAIYRWLCQPSSLSKGLLFALSKSQWLMQVRRLDAMSYNNNTRLGSWHKQKLQTLFTR